MPKLTPELWKLLEQGGISFEVVAAKMALMGESMASTTAAFGNLAKALTPSEPFTVAETLKADLAAFKNDKNDSPADALAYWSERVMMDDLDASLDRLIDERLAARQRVAAQVVPVVPGARRIDLDE